MVLDLRLQHALRQQLVMTPQLSAAIRLLQLSHEELAQLMRRHLQDNPLLEELPSPPTSLGPPCGAAAGTDGEGWPREGLREATLREHMAWQAETAGLGAAPRAVALLLIDCLDEDGYLPEDCIATVSRAAGQPPSAVLSVLLQLQTFEPVGVAARSLRECLLLQLDSQSPCDPLARRIVAEPAIDLAKVARRDLRALARQLTASVERAAQAVAAIARLNPRPGRAWGGGRAPTVVPDIVVERAPPEVRITLNEEGMPRLAISHRYRESLGGAGPAERAYIQEHTRQATWLLRSVAMRQRTIFRVMHSIVDFQRDFFAEGPAHLKPLVLRQVADSLHMHESTISRVSSNKVVQTPFGLFELKYFFSSSIRRLGRVPQLLAQRPSVGPKDAVNAEESIASASVRAHIRSLIRAEDPRAPLSDQKIVEKLQACDIDIARRTVAKYREMLKIEPSSLRRRFF